MDTQIKVIAVMLGSIIALAIIVVILGCYFAQFRIRNRKSDEFVQRSTVRFLG